MVKPLKTSNFRTAKYAAALKLSEAILRGEMGSYGSPERNDALKIGFKMLGDWLMEVDEIIAAWRRKVMAEVGAEMRPYVRPVSPSFDYHSMLMRIMRMTWPCVPSSIEAPVRA